MVFNSGIFPQLIHCDKKIHTKVALMYLGRIFLPLIGAAILFSGCSTASLRNSLNRHTGFANVLQSIAFSTDGKLIAAGGWAGEDYVELYDVETLKLIKALKRKPKELNSAAFIAFSPDGKYLATTGIDDPMIIWDIRTGEEFYNFTNFTSVSEGIYAADGRILNLSELKIVWEIAYSPDGKVLATAGPKNEVHLFDSKSGRELTVLSGHAGDVKCLAFSRSGKLLATGSADGFVLLWNVISRKNIAKTYRHQSPVTSLSFSADDKTLLSTDYHQANIWMLASNTPSEPVLSEQSLVHHMEKTSDNIALMPLMDKIEIPESPYISKGQYSRDGRHLALKSYNEGRYVSFDIYQIMVKNLITNEAKTIKGTYLDFAFSPDGGILAMAGRGVKLWDTINGKEILK